jgi:tRNA A-37 threonylcarbamoyl transferase component Bud32
MIRVTSFVCCLLAATPFVHAFQPQLPEIVFEKGRPSDLSRLQGLVEAKKWKEVSHRIESGLRSHTLARHDIQKLAHQCVDSAFALAYQGTRAILSIKETTGLSFEVLFPIALSIETTLPNEIAQGAHFWPESRFGRELQYDEESGRLFIHLGTKGVKPLGEGRKKIVTKTVLYDRFHPEVMARGVTEWDVRKEMNAMRALKGLPGILEPEALMIHTKPHGHKRLMTIVTRIYRPGSLQDVLDNHSLHLTLDERLKIAHDILKGMASLHGQKFVHRDLGARNYFVKIRGTKPGRRKVEAVVADMGRTIPISEAKNVPVQGNSTYIAPEGFFRSKMAGKDYYYSDIFAVGSVLWQLYSGHVPEWRKKRFFSHESQSVGKRHHDMISCVQHNRERALDHLKRQHHLTKNDRFLALIVQMIHPVPHKRGTAKELCAQCATIRGK